MGALSLDRFILRVPVLWRALAAMLILCGALLALVESRASILRSGAEIRLKTAPVDPRDLFRGDYVVLGYEIGTIDGSAVEGDRMFAKGDAIHVSLVPDGEGFARVKAVHRNRPATSSSDIVIAGRVTTTGACALNAAGETDCEKGRTRLGVRYGLESYYVPQGTGLAIERTERKRIEIVAAVSASGEAAIKRLLIDGKLVHAEPPY